MKTAMQFLKEEIKNKIIPSSKENGELSEYQYSHNVAYGTVLTIIEYLLEKEKEQIVNAFEVGYKSCDIDEALEINRKLASGEQHYNKTYNL
jgi:hypothetical protein